MGFQGLGNICGHRGGEGVLMAALTSVIKTQGELAQPSLCTGWDKSHDATRSRGDFFFKSVKVLKKYFLGGPVVKNPTANARHIGLIPDPRRFHMPQSN